jgi:hypothetical protein
MARVCRAGGCVAVVDLLSPDDRDLRETHNRLERIRDPSHTTALTREELLAAMEAAGLVVESVESRDVALDFARWTDMTDTPPADRACIEDALTRELHDGPATGMRPFVTDGRLKFLHTWATAIARKDA